MSNELGRFKQRVSQYILKSHLTALSFRVAVSEKYPRTTRTHYSSLITHYLKFLGLHQHITEVVEYENRYN